MIPERVVSRPAVDHHLVQFIAAERDGIATRTAPLPHLTGNLGAFTPVIHALRVHEPKLVVAK